MGETLKFGKTEVTHDGFYSSSEMEKVRTEIETNTSLDLAKMGAKFNRWVRTEVSGSNKRHLEHPETKKNLGKLKALLQKKYTDFNANGNSIYVVQFILSKEYQKTGIGGKALVLDGKFGVNTFKALIDYQENSNRYKNTDGGRPDGVANGRTIKSFLVELESSGDTQMYNVSEESDNQESQQNFTYNQTEELPDNFNIDREECEKPETTASSEELVDGSTDEPNLGTPLRPEETISMPEIDQASEGVGENENTDLGVPLRPQLNTSEKVEKISYTNKYIYDNGFVYLIGPDGEYIKQEQELDEKSIEIIKGIEKVAILGEILDIWKSAVRKKSEDIKDSWCKSDDYNILLSQVGEVERLFGEVFEKVQTGKDYSQDIQDIWKSIELAEQKESIIGEGDMLGKNISYDTPNRSVRERVDGVKDIWENESLTKDQKLQQIYNKMRYGGISGNSDMVKSKLENHLFADTDFKDVVELLENKNILKYLINGQTQELLNLGIDKQVVEELIEAKKKIVKEVNIATADYNLSDINEQRKNRGLKPYDSLSDFRNEIIANSTFTILKDSVLRKKIESMDYRGSESDSYTGIYANLTGLGETELGDYFTISDNNIDTAVEVGINLALAGVSMGVGFAAARGAMALGRTALSVSKVGSGVDKLSKVRGFGNATALGRLGTTIGIEGAAFYEGYTISNNLLYGKEWDSETRNGKEIMKSIAFFGVLRGIGKVAEKMIAVKGVPKAELGRIDKFIQGTAKMTDKVVPSMLQKSTIAKVLAEAGLLTSTSLGIDISFGDREDLSDWSWGEYLQAIMMVVIMRKKIKNPDSIKSNEIIVYKKGGKIHGRTRVGEKGDTVNNKEATSKINNQTQYQKDYEMLGIKEGKFYSKTELREIYRKKVKENHPDRGGDKVTMAEINAAYKRVTERTVQRGHNPRLEYKSGKQEKAKKADNKAQLDAIKKDREIKQSIIERHNKTQVKEVKKETKLEVKGKVRTFDVKQQTNSTRTYKLNPLGDGTYQVNTMKTLPQKRNRANFFAGVEKEMGNTNFVVAKHDGKLKVFPNTKSSDVKLGTNDKVFYPES